MVEDGLTSVGKELPEVKSAKEIYVREIRVP